MAPFLVLDAPQVESPAAAAPGTMPSSSAPAASAASKAAPHKGVDYSRFDNVATSSDDEAPPSSAAGAAVDSAGARSLCFLMRFLAGADVARRFGWYGLCGSYTAQAYAVLQQQPRAARLCAAHTNTQPSPHSFRCPLSTWLATRIWLPLLKANCRLTVAAVLSLPRRRGAHHSRAARLPRLCWLPYTARWSPRHVASAVGCWPFLRPSRTWHRPSAVSSHPSICAPSAYVQIFEQ